MKTFVVSAMAVSTTTAMFTFGNKCPAVIPAVDDFDAEAYMGRWYEIQRDSWNSFELGAECVTATYTLRIDG